MPFTEAGDVVVVVVVVDVVVVILSPSFLSPCSSFLSVFTPTFLPNKLTASLV